MAIDISSTTRRIVYTGSAGVGPYAFNFEILTQTDIAVYKNDTELTLTTDYTVSISGDGTGSVTLVVAATGSDRITIVGDRTIERSTDFTTGGPLFATSLNDEFDSLTIFTQQNLEANNRAIKAPVTDPSSINMTLPKNTDRAGKFLSFNASGNPQATTYIGTYKGNWAASTAYILYDVVKDTSNNNIYICITAHTSSGSQPISSNADSAKWALLVDSASASDFADEAEAWATKTDGIVESTDYSSKAWSIGGTGVTNTASRGAAKEWATKAEDSTVDGSEYSAKHYSAKASASASAASSSASAASSSASAASSSASSASSSATAASNAQTAAEAARDSALAAYDNFDDRYLGAKSSDPTLDNDGNALIAGALYFNTTDSVMKLYTGSAWVAAYVSGGAFLASANNLSDLDNATTALTNLGFTATATELNYTNGVTSNIQTQLDAKVAKTASTGSAVMPVGTDGQRDGSPSAGYLRFNSTSTSFEGYDGTAWGAIGGGASASGAIYENTTTISENYTLTTGSNGFSVGPITISAGYAVTVPSGQKWVVL